MKTVDAAQGKWSGILAHFGMDQRYLDKKHHDCPLCGDGKDRFRFTDHEGKGLWVCNQCGGGSGMDLLMRFTGKGFRELASEIDAIVGNIGTVQPKPRDYAKARARIQEIYASAVETDINPVRKYLRGRGLPSSKALKYTPRLKVWDGEKATYHPGMAALIMTQDGKCSGIHLTHLTEQGEKADVEPQKKIIKAVDNIKGGAIRLTPVYEHIGIAEGIETALAVMRDYRVPCWAAISATLMEGFEVPDGVKKVSIFADNDKTFTGQKAAYTLANRLSRNYAVEVILPEFIGDFADTGEMAP